VLTEFGIVGRDREISTIEQFLRQPVEGASVLAIRGEPGIGKTTVIRETMRAADRSGWSLYTALPTEVERDMPYAALQDLLGGVADDIVRQLPGPQRQALMAIHLREAPPPGGLDARTVGTAVLNALRADADRHPLLLVIDDVQWLDPASRGALTFALRRLEAGVRIIIGERVEDLGLGSTFDLRPLPVQELLLPGISLAALYHLLRERLEHAFPRPVLVRIAAWSGGNPMLALEIGRRLLAAGVRTSLDSMPLAPVLGSLVDDRLRAQPLGVRRTLLAIALEGEIDEAGLDALMARLEWPVLLPDANQGILAGSFGHFRFAHPLLAATTIATAAAADRRQVHAALAAGSSDPVARARHLALATTAREEDVAAAAAAASQLAGELGATETALELAELAVARTPVEAIEEGQRRQLELGRVAKRAGDHARAEVALGAAASGPGTDEAVMAMIEQIEIKVRQSESEASQRAALARIRAAGNRMLLAQVALVIPGPARWQYRHARAAVRLLGAGASPALRARAIGVKAAAALEAGRAVSMDELDLAVSLEAASPPREIAAGAAFLRSWIIFFEDDLVRSKLEFEELFERAVALGDERSVAAILRELTHIEIRAGRWSRAEELATATLRAAEQGGQRAGEAMAHLQLGAIAALRGQLAKADSELGQAETLGEATGMRRAVGLAIGRRGQLSLSLGELDAAVRAFERSEDTLLQAGVAEPALTNWRGEHAEALTRLDRVGEAEALIDKLEAAIGTWRRPVSRAIVERTRAFIAAERGDTDTAIQLAAASVDRLQGLHEPFELARSLEIAGIVHRRARHKAVAAARLGEAIAQFQALGATEWAARARSELGRVGLRPRAPRSLTETEMQVARLAAAGLTNREVARRTFMSPRTVEAVLARAYAKLGVASRAELGGTLGGIPGSPDRHAARPPDH
jgi:DNA-binding CsgD family transcriptional regulator